jgi:hypothetical protein
MADAFDEENAQLWLPRLDVVYEKLSPMNGAVSRIQYSHSTTLVEEICEQLVERVKRHLLAYLGRSFILRVEEIGRLVHFFAGFGLVKVEFRRLV